MEDLHRRAGSPDVLTVYPCRAEILSALARVLDHAAGDAVGHHARVAVIAGRLAALGDGADTKQAFYAGLVHDIGMMAGPGGPPHRWNLEDQANDPTMRHHPLVGAQVLGSTNTLFGVAQTVLDHHEWVDGHGYPRGKAGEEIATTAQAVRFADTCDMLLREQDWPELIAFIHAVRSRTRAQVGAEVAGAGIEVLGEPGFYPQLPSAEDVSLLVDATIRRHAADDLVTSDADLMGLLELFGQLTDSHPRDKLGHSRRVANLAVLVGLALGLEERDTCRIKWAALVHDIGLVDVPKRLLDKPGMLSTEELAEVRQHATLAERFIRPIHGLEEVADIAAAHGEAFDGTGYPRGLQGADIPLGARILAVCDTFDALTSRRPYREARASDLAVDILVKGSGSVFDPDVVEAAIPTLMMSRSAEEPVAAEVH